jgi:ATP-binding cassette subfamily C (CFTR/MRP) protein 1
VPAAVLSFVAALALAFSSHFEHIRSIRPSFLIGLYLVITSLLRAAAVRTYWLIEGNASVTSSALASLLVQLVILVLESYSKQQWLLDENERLPREAAASFLSRSLFAWLNDLLVTGYRRPLVSSDLQIVDQNLETALLATRFQYIQKDLSRKTHTSFNERTS